jgi:heme-degrading monooxygenase HmoA
MYVTLRNYAGNQDLVDALVENESSVKQLISEIDGFKAYYLVRTAAGEALSVSVYDDKTGGEASNRAAAGWIRENLPDMSVSAPQVTEGEAVIAF